MKTLTIHHLTPTLALSTMLLVSACNGLTGIDPDESLTPDAISAQRTLQVQEEPVAREIPDFATPHDEPPLREPQPLRKQYEARVVNDVLIELSATCITETSQAITVRIGARAQDRNLYYVLRQVEGEAPALVRFFNGTSPAVTETLSKDITDRVVEYWIVDDGGAEMTNRIRFKMLARALP